MTTTQAWAGYITKSEKTPDGDLMVYGKATGPDLDLDGQIADPRWLRKAMPDWMAWGNVREMHRPSAAGVGRELTADGTDWNLKALVVDKAAAEKVEKGVYKGFSIGIKDPQVIKDRDAPGGRIVGGTVIEVSLVDRPCNPTATMGIAKAYGAALGPVEWAGEVVGKAAEDGDAPDDPAWTVTTNTDGDPDPDDGDAELLADAAKAATDDEPPIFAAVAKGALDTRARDRLSGAVLTPVAYRKAVSTMDAVLSGTLVKRTADESADIAGAQAVIAQLARLIISEATELAAGRCEEDEDIECLMRAVQAVKSFMWREQRQDGQDFPDADAADGPTAGGDMAYIGLGARGDLGKRDFTQAERDDAADSGEAMPDGRYPIKSVEDLKNAIGLAGHGKGSKAKIRAHIVRRARALGQSAMIPDDWSAKAAMPDGVKAAVGPDLAKMIDDAVTKATQADKERIQALEAEVAKVQALPVPGGPFILPAPATVPTPADDRSRRAAGLLQTARHTSDPAVAHAYRSAARAITTE